MNGELAIPAGRSVDVDRWLRPALACAAAFLAIEPPLRVLLWWRDPGTGPALHSDVIWLAFALCAVLAVPLAADIRALVMRRRWLIGAGIIWTLAAAGSALLIENRSPGTALRWAFYLGFALCLLAALRRRPADAPPLLVAAVSGFLALVAGLLAFLALAAPSAEFDWATQLPGAFNVRNLGFEALAVVMIGSLYRPRTAVAWLMRLGAIAGWAFLFWSGARGSLLAGLVTLALMAVLAGRLDGRFVEIVVLMLIGAGLAQQHTPPDLAFGAARAVGATAVGIETAAGPDVSAGRFQLWAESARTIAENPLFGIGEGQIRYHVRIATGAFPQPHNLLLQGAVAWGLAGGAAFLVAVIFPLWRAIRRAWRQSRLDAPASAGLAMALAMATQSMLDGTLFHPRPVIMFLVGCAVALAAPRHSDDGASTS